MNKTLRLKLHSEEIVLCCCREEKKTVYESERRMHLKGKQRMIGYKWKQTWHLRWVG